MTDIFPQFASHDATPRNKKENKTRKNLTNTLRSINDQEPIHIFLRFKPLDEQETQLQENKKTRS